jgi:glycine cleavage system aminomethyltransferase T
LSPRDAWRRPTRPSYRAWGAEISPDDTPLEAGLSFAIDWKKSFPGREALLERKQGGWTRLLLIFVLEDPEPMLWGSEPIYRNGQAVGYTTSGSYGHSVGAAIAIGYVSHPAGMSAGFLESGTYESNISRQRYRAKAFLRAPYDPERKKILV